MILCRVLIVFLLYFFVKCERFFSAHSDERSPRYVDTIKDFDDNPDLSNMYHYGKEPSWLTKYQSHKYSSSLEDPQELIYQDTLNFQYPSIEFLNNQDDDNSDDNSKYDINISLRPTESTDSNEYKHSNKTRRFKFRKFNRPQRGYRPFRTSHIQRVYKPTSTTVSSITSNRYEEADLASNSLELPMNITDIRNTTDNNIQHILKNYFLKLYSQKYNTPESSASIKPSSYSKLYSDNELNVEPETKFFNTVVTNNQVFTKTKLFSLFTIVQFNNTECNATSTTGSYQGVCYTASECDEMMGTAVGDCAEGYGVCCVGE